MTSFVVAFFVSLGVATVMTALVLRFALTRGLYDQPDHRKVHARPIPRLGGVAIVIGFFVPVTELLIVEAGARDALTRDTLQLVGLYVGGFLIAALGLFDDLRGANARQKLVVEVAVALLMYGLGYRIEAISNPFGGSVELGVLALPVTVLWFVGVMNAVNLIDGLDGLAGGIGLISVMTLFALSAIEGDTLGCLLCACLGGSLVGFLIFNFNPARIFMGDTGSLFLGFVLASFSIASSNKGSTAIALVVPILALGLPIVDTMWAIGRRFRAQRPIFSADQEHIHHRLLKAGFSHRGAVLTLYGLALALAGAALLTRAVSQPVAGLVVLAAAVVLFVVLRLLTSRPRLSTGLADPFGAEGLSARAALEAAERAILAAPTPAALGVLLDALADQSRVLAALVLDGDRPLYVRSREASAHEAMRPIVSDRLPLAERGGHQAVLEIRFARAEVHARVTPDLAADLGVVLPWERLATAIQKVLVELDWRPMQTPVPPVPPAPIGTPQLQPATVLGRVLGGGAA